MAHKEIWLESANAEKDETLHIRTRSGHVVHINRKAGKRASFRKENTVSNKNLKNFMTKKGWVTSGVIAAIAIGLIQPSTLLGVAILAGVSLVIGKTVDIAAPGVDTTTHNAPDNKSVHYGPKPEPKPAEKPLTGNEAADAVIRKGHEMLAQIRSDNRAITDMQLTLRMNQIEECCESILSTITGQPDKVPQVRKFMNYYLPTTLKLLANYRNMQEHGVSAQTMLECRATTLRGLDMVLTACRKQVDNLYRGDMLDLNTDIDVLEQMLKRDGYMESEGSDAAPQIKTSQTSTAAAEQLRHGAPTLNVPNSGIDDDFMEYYRSRVSSDKKEK